MSDLDETDENVKPPKGKKEIEKVEIPKEKSGPENTVQNIGASFAENMPKIQEHAIQDRKDESEKVDKSLRTSLKQDGEKFDPEIHAVDKVTGKPKLTSSGNFAKKRGRKSGAPKSKVGKGKNVVETTKAQQDARMVGVTAAHTLITVCVGIFGQEWRPVIDEENGLDEKQQLEMAFANYMEAKEVADIPAGIALALAIGFYALPKIGQPKTQNRLSKGKTKLKQWFVGYSDKRKNRKTKKKKEK